VFYVNRIFMAEVQIISLRQWFLFFNWDQPPQIWLLADFGANL